MNYETARSQALKRDRVCQNCGSEEDLHAHHIIPRSDGGPDTPENLVILCKYCHPKFEGTEIRPRLAGEGVRIQNIVLELSTETIWWEAAKEVEPPPDLFKEIQRDETICSNCFRRKESAESQSATIARYIMSTVFQDIIQDPDVCSNCFRRTHDRFERNYRLDTYFNDEKGEWDVRPTKVSGVEIELPDGSMEVIGGMDDNVFRQPANTMKIPEKGAIRGMRTICECGFRYQPSQALDDDETWKNRPLDKSTFFDYAENLAERMREKDVDFSEEAFFEVLDQLKSDPDEQFADDRIYKKACQHASAAKTVEGLADS